MISPIDLTIDKKTKKMPIGSKKKQKTEWELNKSFQDTWATKFPWAKHAWVVISKGGK
jgi:hypothetical protein